MSHKNILYYFMGAIIFAVALLSYAVSEDLGAIQKPKASAAEGHALVELTSREYQRHHQLVDSLISVDEISVVSDADGLELCVSQKNMSVFLNIKPSHHNPFSEASSFPIAIVCIIISIASSILYLRDCF